MRITVANIVWCRLQQHPWYNKPLLPHYAEAFEKMQRAQDELNRKHAAAPLDYVRRIPTALLQRA